MFCQTLLICSCVVLQAVAQQKTSIEIKHEVNKDMFGKGQMQSATIRHDMIGGKNWGGGGYVTHERFNMNGNRGHNTHGGLQFNMRFKRNIPTEGETSIYEDNRSKRETQQETTAEAGNNQQDLGGGATLNQEYLELKHKFVGGKNWDASGYVRRERNDVNGMRFPRTEGGFQFEGRFKRNAEFELGSVPEESRVKRETQQETTAEAGHNQKDLGGGATLNQEYLELKHKFVGGKNWDASGYVRRERNDVNGMRFPRTEGGFQFEGRFKRNAEFELGSVPEESRVK